MTDTFELHDTIQNLRSNSAVSDELTKIHHSLEIARLGKRALRAHVVQTTEALKAFETQTVVVPTHEYFYPSQGDEDKYVKHHQSDYHVPIDVRGRYERITLFDEREQLASQRAIGKHPVKVCVELAGVDESPLTKFVPIDKIDGVVALAPVIETVS